MYEAKNQYFDTIFLDTSRNNNFITSGSKNASLNSLWFSSLDLSEIYQRPTKAIEKEVEDIFNKCELDREISAKIFPSIDEVLGKDQIIERTEYFNLNVAILVGLKLEASIARKFRRWSSDLISDYLIKGYVLNHKRIDRDKAVEIKEKIHNLIEIGKNNEYSLDSKKVLTDLAKSFSKAFVLMDEVKITNAVSFVKADQQMIYSESKELIQSFRKILEEGESFGLEKEYTLYHTRFTKILTNIMSSSGEDTKFSNAQMRAAHLLYDIIKERPFIDGNKRIASMLFLYYLEISGIKLIQINSNTLAAMALLVSYSRDDKEDIIIKFIINLIG